MSPTSRTPTGDSPVLLTGASDPVAAFWDAHRRGRSIAVRTSGTTAAAARTIVRTTASWIDSFDAVAARLGLTASDRVWIPGEMDSTMNLFAACLAGHVGAGWSVDAAGATVAQLTPTGLDRLLADASARPGSARPGSARPGSALAPGATCLIAGDALSASLRDRARAAGLRVEHYYGAAELSLVAWGTCADDLAPFTHVEVDVRDGVLWVRSPWLSLGPAPGTPQGAWRADRRGFATVGDLGRLDGGVLRVLGRPGSVTTAGATVTLAPLAVALSEHASEPVRLVGVPHPRLGEVLTAVVRTPADRDSARAWARRNLSGGERPRAWVVVDELPVTKAGKVDQAALARRAGEILAGRSASGSPGPSAGGPAHHQAGAR